MHCRLWYVCVMSLMLSGCSDLPLSPSGLDGTYIGTFTITDSNGLELSGTVTFAFSGNTYTCIPERRYLPPSGAGCFTLVGRTMVLKDTVAHTAEFDHTLILNGPFPFIHDGVHLVLVQEDEQYRRHRVIDLTRQ
jgi:hypothetical protein